MWVFSTKMKKVYAERAAQNAKDQNARPLARETLLDIYGASIRKYSSTGKRANRPAIDSKLFDGLLGTFFSTLFSFLFQMDKSINKISL